MKLTKEDGAAHFAIAQSCWPDDVFLAAEKAYLAGMRAMAERAAKVCERKGQDVADDHYHVEPDTNAGVFDTDEAAARAEMADDCAAAIRKLIED